MRSPFLIIRFIFLSVLLYLNLLDLVFAAWNIGATKGLGLSVPGGSILLIFNAIASLFFLGLGLLELFAPNFAATSVTFECSWSAILSLLHIGAAIGSTITVPILIQQTSDWAVSASSFLLIPTTWLTSLTMLGYFFVLFVCATSHTRFEVGIWSKPVSQVKWFGYTNSRLKSADVSGPLPRPRPDLENDSWTRYLEDIESSGHRKARHPVPEEEKAPWAPTNVVRGRDAPFRGPAIPKRDSTDSESSFSVSPRPTSAALPPLPLKVQVKGGKSIGSRFVERFRESRTISRPSRPVIDFPHEVDDHDKPIPLPRLSQWIKADTLKALTSR